jgi:hypothetical protein
MLAGRAAIPFVIAVRCTEGNADVTEEEVGKFVEELQRSDLL